MDLLESTQNILSFAQSNTIIAIILTLSVIFFMWRKPKVFFGILSLGLFLAGLFYLIMSLAGSGAEQKKRLLHEDTHPSLEEGPRPQ